MDRTPIPSLFSCRSFNPRLFKKLMKINSSFKLHLKNKKLHFLRKKNQHFKTYFQTFEFFKL